MRPRNPIHPRWRWPRWRSPAAQAPCIQTFDPATSYHYALTCSSLHDTLHVTAQVTLLVAPRRLTLRRANPDDNQTCSPSGTLDVQLIVNQHDHDVAIELTRPRRAARTYVVHCLPDSFPTVNVLTKTDEVSDGLLLVTPRLNASESYMAVLDNNGVPRFHRYLALMQDGVRRGAEDFRRHPDGRYSISLARNPRLRNRVRLYDTRFDFIKAVGVVPPLEVTDGHEFVIAPNGNYLFISYSPRRTHAV